MCVDLDRPLLTCHVGDRPRVFVTVGRDFFGGVGEGDFFWFPKIGGWFDNDLMC